MAAAPEALFASVVFLRVEGFGSRPASEQARLRAQLEAVVAVSAAGLPAAARAVLDAADGAVVVVLGDPRGALRLAEGALHGVVAGLPLCVGVNHGAVQAAGDGIAGDGIAVAAALARFAQPAQLLVSGAFRDALADAAPGAEAALAPRGARKDEGLRTHELFAPDQGAARRRSARYLAASLAVALGLGGAAVGVRIAAEGQQQFAERVAGSVRGAVLQVSGWARGLSAKAGL